MDIKMWLDKLYYQIGRQQYDFRLCGLKKIKGETISTKWKKYSEIVFPVDFNEGWKLKWVNQREILPNEVVLDLEVKEQLKPILRELRKIGVIYYVFSTESRGLHIHIFFNRKITDEERRDIIEYFGTDSQIISGHMIALEYTEHWKSGEIKKEIKEDG